MELISFIVITLVQGSYGLVGALIQIQHSELDIRNLRFRRLYVSCPICTVSRITDACIFFSIPICDADAAVLCNMEMNPEPASSMDDAPIDS